MNNLAPARIGWGAGHKPEWLFNRRWLLKPDVKVPNPFGETTDRIQMNPPPGSTYLQEPAGPVDPQLYVLSVQHADGRPLALLANYGLHYVGGTGPGTVSADYFGAFAERIQVLLQADHQDPGFVGIMTNGTSGDVNAIDFSKPAGPPLPPYSRIRRSPTAWRRRRCGCTGQSCTRTGYRWRWRRTICPWAFGPPLRSVSRGRRKSGRRSRTSRA